MFLFLAVGLGFFARTALRRWKLMKAAAAPADRSDEPGRRIGQVVRYVFGQARMFRYEGAGVAHALIFAGFVVLALRTVILFARGFTGYTPYDFMRLGYREGPGFGFWLFDDDAALGIAYLFLKDLIGLGVILGVAYFLYLRLVKKPRRMELSREGIFILCMILGIIVSDLVYEASGVFMAAGDRRVVFHWATPVASTVAYAFAAVNPMIVVAFHHLGFWSHAIIVLTFLNFLPYGKHFHILTIIPQVYTANPQPRGRLAPIPDIEGRIERSETLGVKNARDLSWKAVLDFYTCTECGRCSDHCPAFNTGKLLSPKHLTMDLRDHMYRNERVLVGSRKDQQRGEMESGAHDPKSNTQNAFLKKDGAADESNGELLTNWIDPEVIWACTTCGACEQECPVFISYVDKIVDLRRHAVMEKGEFPEQLQNAFQGLERVGNPYSFANEHRTDWAAGLDIPLRSEKPGAAILYWVGCSPSFDDRAKKIARATATLMKQAGVDFAILGPEEMCTGDPARRAGNEYLFETLARQNVETLNNYRVKKIVATCPHCFNTIRNEYPDFGGKFEVVHHTDFLLQLVREGKLKLANRVDGTVVYHDSCYLGRYNDIYDPPRELLKSIPGLNVVEAKESRDRGMCCGAGGAQMWKEEEPIRRPGSREGDGKVNHARARQLLRVLPTPRSTETQGPASVVASACPFCMTMLRDGLRDQGHDDVQQMDVAEVLLKATVCDSSAG
jgi:Fe-S oxidoreductase